MFKFLVNPNRFNNLTNVIFKPLVFLTLIMLIIGLVFVYFSPLDYQQGLTVKIMYIHVPSAWLALLTYAIMTIYSILGLAAIFAGAKVPIIIMGAVLEVGKLVTASWLYQNWKNPLLPKSIKYYLTTSVVVLVFVT